MDRDEIWRWTHHERAALADLLDGLSPEQWEHPSLCPGWTVRDVAAHVISSPQAHLRDVVAAMVRARGNFNRAIRDEARRAGRRPVPEIVADYRRLVGSRRRPPGTMVVDPLLDVLVHTQDIALPLGLSHPMPPAAARVAADRVWRFGFLFRARRRFAGLHLRATDVEWDAGAGALVEGPMEVLLLVLTGRPVGLARLHGDGVARIAKAPR
jgi:uncharacterized protein (TIGR03083 family)